MASSSSSSEGASSRLKVKPEEVEEEEKVVVAPVPKKAGGFCDMRRGAASNEQYATVETRLAVLLKSDDDTLTLKKIRKQLQVELADVDFSTDITKKWLKDAVLRISTSADNEATEGEITEGEPKHPLVSDALAEVLGVRRANFFRVTKLIWVYIKRHDLQNPQKKKEILCDAKLEALFGCKKVDSFKMSKHFQQHILNEEVEKPTKKRAAKIEDSDEEAAPKKAKKAKKTKASAPEGDDAPSKKKRVKHPPGYRGTAELAAFIGQETNNRFSITGLMWKHIKANNLQNPLKKNRIICDAALVSLFGVKEFGSFELATHIAKHFE